MRASAIVPGQPPSSLRRAAAISWHEVEAQAAPSAAGRCRITRWRRVAASRAPSILFMCLMTRSARPNGNASFPHR